VQKKKNTEKAAKLAIGIFVLFIQYPTYLYWTDRQVLALKIYFSLHGKILGYGNANIFKIRLFASRLHWKTTKPSD